MPQPGYGPVKRMLFDSVLTLPTSITSLRNITGGRDTGQIRYNKADSAIYVHTGYGWIKDNSGGTITSIATGLGLSGGTITSSGTLIVDTSSASILSRQRAAYTYAPISITGTVTSVTGTSPVVSSGGATPAISMPVATTSVNGYLSSANWTTFNAKESALTFSSPLSRSTNTISIPAATTSVNGYLSSTDWTTFNNKQATISATSPVVLTGAAISIPAATTSVNGYLSSTDWTTFNNKVTSVTGTAPVVSSGGTTPAISMAAATTSVNGYLTSANWTTFNNKQATITLTTTGTSGASTLVGATLNIPNYADAYVGTVTSVAALTLGTTGTDLSSTVATGTTTPVITLQVPTASATNRGALSSADWSTFNNKAAALSGTTNYLPKFTSASTIGNSVIYQGSSNIGIGETNPTLYPLQVKGADGQGIQYEDANAVRTLLGSYLSKSIIGTLTNHAVGFWSNNSEKMILYTSGNFGLGTTTDAGYKLDVNGTGRFSNAVNVFGANLAHAANKTVLSQEGSSNGAFWQSYGADASTKGKFTLRQYSSDGSISAIPLSIDTTGAATFSSSVSVGNFTTTEINALTGVAGMVVFNTTLSVLCFYDGTSWKKVSHSAM